MTSVVLILNNNITIVIKFTTTSDPCPQLPYLFDQPSQLPLRTLVLEQHQLAQPLGGLDPPQHRALDGGQLAAVGGVGGLEPEVGLALVVGPAVLREQLVPHAVGVGGRVGNPK